MDPKQRQVIPVFRDARPARVARTAFSDGHVDGYADAVNGHPRDPAARFQSWHRARDVRDYSDYERGYVASYEQVKAAVAR